MKKTRIPGQPVSADAISRLADKGKDVSHFFKGQGRMVQPIQRVNVDVTAAMLEELDKAAQELNVSRQAVIKTLVRQALDQHYLAQSKATRSRRPRRHRDPWWDLQSIDDQSALDFVEREIISATLLANSFGPNGLWRYATVESPSARVTASWSA